MMTSYQHLQRLGRLLLPGALVILSYCSSPGSMPANDVASFPERVATTPSVQFSDFAGAAVCAECHSEHFAKWQSSTHGQAGGLPGEVKLIARFDGKALRFKDALVYPERDGSNLHFRVQQEGHSEQLFPVAGIVGGGHMIGGGTQSFFTRLEDGSWRFLPFDFIRAESIWFVQLADSGYWVPVDRSIALGDLMNWPPHRVLGEVAGLSNCQNCHGSQIFSSRNAQGQFDTRFTTLAINCESCHGPGKRHAELMRSPASGSNSDIGLQSLTTLTKDASLQVCFQCHATKDALQPGYLPGEDLESFYSLKLPILAGEPYLPDGKVNSFAYQQNHLFSDCYVNGSMTCVDCHDPHSNDYRDISGNVLIGKFNDRQCTGCHSSKGPQPGGHTHHKAGSEASRCTSCHMPFLQHRGLGKQLRFARSDHTISAPRPAYDFAMGIDNACMQCHRDRSNEWIIAKTHELWGPAKPLPALIRGLMHADSLSNRLEAASVLLQPQIGHAIAQYTALAAFVRNWIQPDMEDLEPAIVEQLQLLAAHVDKDVRALALTALHLSRGEHPQMRAFLQNRLAASDSSSNAIRDRWVISMDYLGSRFAGRKDFWKAIPAYKKALELNPSDSFVLLNLAVAYEQVYDIENAIAACERAIAVDSSKITGQLRLGNLLKAAGQFREARQVFQEVTRLEPANREAQRLLQELKAGGF